MTWFQVKLPEYSEEFVEADSDRKALSKAVFRMFKERPGKPLYYAGKEFSKEQAGALIDLLNQNGVHNYVVETVQVPALVGLPLVQAEERLNDVGLELGSVKSLSLFDIYVVAQNPEFAERVPVGSYVGVTTDFKKSTDLKKLAQELEFFT